MLLEQEKKGLRFAKESRRFDTKVSTKGKLSSEMASRGVASLNASTRQLQMSAELGPEIVMCHPALPDDGNRGQKRSAAATAEAPDAAPKKKKSTPAAAAPPPSTQKRLIVKNAVRAAVAEMGSKANDKTTVAVEEVLSHLLARAARAVGAERVVTRDDLFALIVEE